MVEMGVKIYLNGAGSIGAAIPSGTELVKKACTFVKL
jgi:hypothetical protein